MGHPGGERSPTLPPMDPVPAARGQAVELAPALATGRSSGLRSRETRSARQGACRATGAPQGPFFALGMQIGIQCGVHYTRPDAKGQEGMRIGRAHTPVRTPPMPRIPLPPSRCLRVTGTPYQDPRSPSFSIAWTNRSAPLCQLASTARTAASGSPASMAATICSCSATDTSIRSTIEIV